MTVSDVLVQQPDPGGVDALVDAPDIQQMIEYIVAGDDAAYPGDGAALTAAEGGIVRKKVAAVVNRAPPEMERLGYDIENSGLPAAVAAIKNGHWLKGEVRQLAVAEYMKGILGGVAGPPGAGIREIREVGLFGLPVRHMEGLQIEHEVTSDRALFSGRRSM